MDAGSGGGGSCPEVGVTRKRMPKIFPTPSKAPLCKDRPDYTG
jgi:hypothetical protein